MCPIKYRHVVINERISKTLKEICFEISTKYETNFIEIGTQIDHINFLVQSIPVLESRIVVHLIYFWDIGVDG